VPCLADGKTLLNVANGNSPGALPKRLEGLSDDRHAGLEIPPGVPLPD
jgi:2,3-bisphosphoglycerate-dependent phosphoglycerate mutase